MGQIDKHIVIGYVPLMYDIDLYGWQSNGCYAIEVIHRRLRHWQSA